MPTPTEAHLKVIAEKIEIIKTQQQGPAGTIPPADMQRITKELQEIGRTVLLLPESFTERYSDVAWSEMAHWASSNIFAGSLSGGQLINMICVLDEAEIEIRRHAYPSNELHQGMIMALNSTFKQCSTEWYSHITTPYLLVSLSVIMLIIRIALQEIGLKLTDGQMTTYGVHAFVIFLIILETQRTPKIDYILTPSVYNFSTLAEFYDSQSFVKIQEIRQIRIILDGRRRLRFWTKFFWVITLIAAIIITSIPNLNY